MKIMADAFVLCTLTDSSIRPLCGGEIKAKSALSPIYAFDGNGSRREFS